MVQKGEESSAVTFSISACCTRTPLAKSPCCGRQRPQGGGLQHECLQMVDVDWGARDNSPHTINLTMGGGVIGQGGKGPDRQKSANLAEAEGARTLQRICGSFPQTRVTHLAQEVGRGVVNGFPEEEEEEEEIVLGRKCGNDHLDRGKYIFHFAIHLRHRRAERHTHTQTVERSPPRRYFYCCMVVKRLQKMHMHEIITDIVNRSIVLIITYETPLCCHYTSITGFDKQPPFH